MKNIIIACLIIASTSLSFGQSETIQNLHKQYDDAFVMFFYKNTLNMLNMQDSKEFEALINGIDKMKLLRISKTDNGFTKDQYKQLVKDYRSEDFEELMSFRQQEININAYIKESGGTTKGIVILLNEAENLTVLDIKGSVPFDKIGDLAKYASDFSDSKLKFD